MTATWVVRLTTEQLPSATRFRLRHGVEVLPQDNFVWLRGRDLDEALQRQLAALPTQDTFIITSDRHLVRWGTTVPQGYLPEGSWQPLARWLTAELPGIGWGAQPTEQIPWQLQRAVDFQTPTVLLTAWEAWFDYAIAAPAIRLQACRFAVNEKQEVLVQGDVLPPLAGRRYAAADGVAVELGWQLSPLFSHAVVRSWLGSDPRGLVLLHGDHTIDKLAEEDFVVASRSAVRETDLSLRSPA